MTHQFKVLSDDALSTSADAVIQDDGSLWSHAATLGKRVRGDSTFDITRDTVENFIRVFKNVPGYRKLCIDYEHGTVNGATDKGEPVPQAGTVLELKGVYAESDFTGSLRIAAEKLTKAAGRMLGDARNFGLWVRWKPTEKAKAYVRAGEITEMSIAFQDNVASNADGSLQGPGLLSIALTNLPFLDDMVPVAASRDSSLRDDDSSAGRAGNHNPQEHVMTQQVAVSTRLLTALAAVTLTAPVDEDSAVTQLTTLGPEVVALRKYRETVSKALGEVDPEKAVAKLSKMQSDLAQFEKDAKDAKAKALKLTVDDTIKKHEKKLGNVPLRTLLSAQLTRELEAGTQLEETETVKALLSMQDAPNLGQTSAADNGANPTEDTKLLARVHELMKTDELKEISRKEGHNAAFSHACDMAEAELLTKTA